MKKNTLLLLIAHGSRKAQANEEVRQLAQQLENLRREKVIACFLEHGAPSISEGIDLAIQESPESILALPYFLTAGRHVQEDLQSILEEKARAHPGTPIRLAPYLGSHPQLATLLAQIAEENL